ncbi:MAG: helix-hairpin-helix domain-containing protein, partial [Acetobacteraceae bacterium]|nr:helix-hairpin-helix domain-containing protein [Acetobacteraceae bacterium]
MSRSERGLVLLFLGLAVAGHGVRLLQEQRSAPGELLLLPGVAPASVAAHRARSVAAGRPLGPGERINPDSATAEELSRLPGIGMRLAKEIVADRHLRGSFGSLAALERVRGIGPATVRRLEPFLHFGSTGVV